MNLLQMFQSVDFLENCVLQQYRVSHHWLVNVIWQLSLLFRTVNKNSKILFKLSLVSRQEGNGLCFLRSRLTFFLDNGSQIATKFVHTFGVGTCLRTYFRKFLSPPVKIVGGNTSNVALCSRAKFIQFRISDIAYRGGFIPSCKSEPKFETINK